MRTLLRTLFLIAGAAVLVYGLLPQAIQPYPIPRLSDAQWLMALWGGVALLGVGAWLAQPHMQALNTRFNLRPGVLNLALVFSMLFVVLTLQLLRNGFVYAETTYNRTSPEDGASANNVRLVLRSARVRRGDIVDRNNVPLVTSATAANGLTRRLYPVAEQFTIEAFSNILGFSSSRFGLAGLEQQWNDYLTGERGQALRSVTDELFRRPGVGGNMQLTLDARLQQRVWSILNNVGGGKPASAVVMDPRSGAVLALVSTPGFDPRELVTNPDADEQAENARIDAAWNAITGNEAGPLLNRPLQGLYVPGSTFKTLTAIGALENPDVQTQPEPVDCPNTFEAEAGAQPVVNAVGPPNFPGQAPLGDIIRAQTGRAVDLPGVFAFSCNTAFAQLGVRLGLDRMVELARRFHIYQPNEAPDRSPDFTDLPTAASQLANNNDFLQSDAAIADTAFGQGELLITPLQMALIGATIANGGVMPEPYLVEAVTDPQDGAVVYQHRGSLDLLDQRRVISQEVAQQMLPIMREGVTIGFGKAANVNNSGGKSGSGEAGEGIIHAAFLAVAPVQNEEPRYVVYVQIENGRDGAGVGAQAAGQILQAAFEILQ